MRFLSSVTKYVSELALNSRIALNPRSKVLYEVLEKTKKGRTKKTESETKSRPNVNFVVFCGHEQIKPGLICTQLKASKSCELARVSREKRIQ